LARHFFQAVPGLNEWASLGKAWFFTGDRAGSPTDYDVVIVDGPSTGHALDMLRVPSVILDAVPPGALRADAEQAWAMMQDPTRSGIVVVTLPEEMPINETFELTQCLSEELALPLAALVANALREPLFSGNERNVLSNLEGAQLRDPSGAVPAAVRRAERESVQSRCLARLSEIRAPLVQLPLHLGGLTEPGRLGQLAMAF
jgi:anion-transporting  ArsA/GET3 family ATPase